MLVLIIVSIKQNVSPNYNNVTEGYKYVMYSYHVFSSGRLASAHTLIKGGVRREWAKASGYMRRETILDFYDF